MKQYERSILALEDTFMKKLYFLWHDHKLVETIFEFNLSLKNETHDSKKKFSLILDRGDSLMMACMDNLAILIITNNDKLEKELKVCDHFNVQSSSVHF